MLGAEQREWLLSALDSSTASWRLIASPSVIARTWCERPSETVRRALLKLKLIDEDGEGPDEDQWDGYPAERSVLLERFGTLDDVVLLSADIHVSLASEVADAGSPPAAVEITSPSLTSQNLDEKLGVGPRDEVVLGSEEAIVAALNQIIWCELASHGYVVCDLDRERLRAEWWHVDGVLEPLPGERCAAAFEVPRGAPRLEQVDV
jgi:alkaline phosphatase D